MSDEISVKRLEPVTDELALRRGRVVAEALLPGVTMDKQADPSLGTFHGAELWRVEKNGQPLFDVWIGALPRGVVFEPGTEQAVGQLFDGQAGDFEGICRAAVEAEGLLGRWARRAFALAEAAEASIVEQPPQDEMLDAMPAAGTFVHVKWKKRWWPAQVQSVAEDSCRVHYDGWEANWDEYVPLDRMCRAPQRVDGVAVGDAVSVDYRGAWYAATVLAVQPDGRLRIHYDGWDASWDEDVVPSRVKLGAPDAPDAGALPGTPLSGDLEAGASVYIEYDGAWYGGTVLARNGQLYRIHYDDWDSSWDEDVPTARLRGR